MEPYFSLFIIRSYSEICDGSVTSTQIPSFLTWTLSSRASFAFFKIGCICLLYSRYASSCIILFNTLTLSKLASVALAEAKFSLSPSRFDLAWWTISA